MSRRRDRDYLADILEAIERATGYAAGLTHEQFLADRRTQDAVVRNLEVIGEAAKNLSRELRARHPEVPWKVLVGVRDRMIHHCFGIDYETVWQIVQEDFPGLLSQIEGILVTLPE